MKVYITRFSHNGCSQKFVLQNSCCNLAKVYVVIVFSSWSIIARFISLLFLSRKLMLQNICGKLSFTYICPDYLEKLSRYAIFFSIITIYTFCSNEFMNLFCLPHIFIYSYDNHFMVMNNLFLLSKSFLHIVNLNSWKHQSNHSDSRMSK